MIWAIEAPYSFSMLQLVPVCDSQGSQQRQDPAHAHKSGACEHGKNRRTCRPSRPTRTENWTQRIQDTNRLTDLIFLVNKRPTHSDSEHWHWTLHASTMRCHVDLIRHGSTWFDTSVVLLWSLRSNLDEIRSTGLWHATVFQSLQHKQKLSEMVRHQCHRAQHGTNPGWSPWESVRIRENPCHQSVSNLNRMKGSKMFKVSQRFAHWSSPAICAHVWWCTTWCRVETRY